MNIYEKLLEVKKTINGLEKDGNGEKFKYVSSNMVLSSIRKKMNELGILLIPEIIDTVAERGDRVIMTQLKMNMTFVNCEKPDEKIKTPWYGQGIDYGSERGVGKALTYAEKYFILKFFNIPTDGDDPAADQGQKVDVKQFVIRYNNAKNGNEIEIITQEAIKYNWNDAEKTLLTNIRAKKIQEFKKRS